MKVYKVINYQISSFGNYTSMCFILIHKPSHSSESSNVPFNLFIITFFPLPYYNATFSIVQLNIHT